MHYNSLSLELNSLPGEIWKPIPGLEGSHEISNFSRVKSLGRISYVPKFKKNRKTQERILKKRLNPDGYPHVYISVSTKDKKIHTSKSIHRLMAITFIPNHLNKKTVNHINAIRSDNRISNLEWATPLEQSLHANRIFGSNCGSKNVNSKLKEKDVIFIKKSHLSNTVLAKKFGVNDRCISSIKVGKSWKHLNNYILKKEVKISEIGKILHHLLSKKCISIKSNVTKDDVRFLNHRIVPVFGLILIKTKFSHIISGKKYYYYKYKIDFNNKNNQAPLLKIKKYLKNEKNRLKTFIENKNDYKNYKFTTNEKKTPPPNKQRSPRKRKAPQRSNV